MNDPRLTRLAYRIYAEERLAASRPIIVIPTRKGEVLRYLEEKLKQDKLNDLIKLKTMNPNQNNPVRGDAYVLSDVCPHDLVYKLDKLDIPHLQSVGRGQDSLVERIKDFIRGFAKRGQIQIKPEQGRALGLV